MPVWTLLLALLSPPAVPTDAATALEALGSDVYREREAAERQLRIRPELLPQIAAAARNHTDPEVQRRCRRLVRPLARTSLAALEPIPGLSALWYDRASDTFLIDGSTRRLLQPYLTAGEESPGPRRPFAGERHATALLLEDLLCAGIPLPALRRLVEHMRAIDAEVCRRRKLFTEAVDLRKPLLAE